MQQIDLFRNDFVAKQPDTDHSRTSSLRSLLRRLDEPTAGQGERRPWVRGWNATRGVQRGLLIVVDIRKKSMH